MTHFIVQARGELSAEGIVDSVLIIPKTSKKCLSIQINRNINYLDNMSFTLSSLDKLVETLAKFDQDRFKITREEFAEEIANGADFNLLLKRGHYPYNLMKTVEDFGHDSLPSREEFYSDLKEMPISDKETPKRSGKASRLRTWASTMTPIVV